MDVKKKKKEKEKKEKKKPTYVDNVDDTESDEPSYLDKKAKKKVGTIGKMYQGKGGNIFGGSGPQEKVLFVDDDPHFLAGIRSSLRKEDYQVIVSNSSEQGLSILQMEKIDVVVCDEQMPGLSGSELLGIVCRNYPDTMRILLTGFPSVDVAARAKNIGEVYRFLTKPCSTGELALAISDCFALRRKAAAIQAEAIPMAPPSAITGVEEDAQLGENGENLQEMPGDEDPTTTGIDLSDLPPEITSLQRLFDGAIGMKSSRSAEPLASRLIEQYWGERHLEGAHDTYRSLIKVSPDYCLHMEHQLRMARELDAMGDAVTALSAWRSLVNAHPEHPQSSQALLRCGELYVEMGRSDWARSCYQTLVDKYPRSDITRAAQARLKQLPGD